MRNYSENHIFSEREDIFFRKSFAARFETLMSQGYLDIFDFLEMFAPQRVAMLRRIIDKIGLDFKGSLIADIRIPPQAVAYFDLKDTIGFNAWYLINADEKFIAHALIHEGIHAGVYSDAQVHDESITETMTRKKMIEVYGEIGFESGYVDTVSELSEYFGEKSFAEIVELIENGDEETFDNFLQLLVIDPLFKNTDARKLTWHSIDNKLKKQWKFIRQMFPRIINSIEERNVGVHSDATMDVRSYKLENLMQKASQRLIKDPQKLAEVFLASTRHIKSIVTSNDIVNTLRDEGFGYLVDFNQNELMPFVQKFAEVHNLQVFNKQSLEVKHIQSAFELNSLLLNLSAKSVN